MTSESAHASYITPTAQCSLIEGSCLEHSCTTTSTTCERPSHCMNAVAAPLRTSPAEACTTSRNDSA